MKAIINTILLITIATDLFSNAFKGKELESGLSPDALFFTENKGQIVDQNYNPRPDVLFSGKRNNLTFHLRNDGISYQLNRIDNYKEVVDPKTNLIHKKVNRQTIYRIDVNWLNSNPAYQLIKGNPSESESNYYTAGCPEYGALHVKNYQQITYQNIYPGIDLMWYEKDGELKYDYICAAGSNYQQINLEINGAEQFYISKDDELIIQTPLGNIIEKAPYVTQNGVELKSKWTIRNNIICFEIENLSPNKPYIIDPAVRVWGTYYGGNNGERIQATTIDLNGNIICSGYTEGATGPLIATTGAHQTTHGGADDAFLVKFDENGVRLWGTYYGGTSADYGYGCTTDNAGNIFWSGYTQSSGTNIIATSGAHQSTLNGAGNAFLVKLNNNGVRQWGTYYGGNGHTWGYDCKIDSFGDVYLVGSTQSNSGTVIATAGSHQSAYGGGTNDGYIAKFNTNGSRIWATYYGGALEDQVLSCRVNSSNELIICGATRSSGSIATSGTHQDVISVGSDYDAFLVKLDPSGTRQWGTYYGGAGMEYGYSICFSSTADIYLYGVTNTSGGTSIATTGAHQVSPGGGGFRDAFLVKFNNNGVRQWGTFYGGSLNEYGLSCDTDANGNIYVAGYTESSNNISSGGSYQSTFGGGVKDAFLAKFNSNGIRSWGTYYGGAGNEEGMSGVVNLNGSVFLSGYTSSGTGTIIATLGSHQANFGGAEDGFLVKFDDCTPPDPTNTTPVSNLTICNGSSAMLSASSGSNTINWYATASSPTILGTGNSFTTPVLSAGTYSYFAEASGCVVSESRTEIMVTVLSDIASSISAQTNVSCNDGSNGAATVVASGSAGAYTYSWSPTGGTSSTATGLVAGTYTCTITDANGCIKTQTVTITEPGPIASVISSQSNVSCNGGSNGAATVVASGGAGGYTYSWSPSGGTSATATGLASGTYTCIITDANSCAKTQTVTITQQSAIASSQAYTLCAGQSVTVGSNTYTTSGTYTDVLTASNGCDSTVTTNLIVNPIISSSNSYTICFGLSVTVGTNTYSTSGTFTDVLTAANGCDSTVTTILTVHPAIDITTSISGNTITANATSGTFQWIDCTLGNTPISGETNQSFTPTTNGNYAVVISDNGCSETSTCVNITITGINEFDLTNAVINVYPNPSTGVITIEAIKEIGRITIYNALGELVYAENINNTKADINISNLNNGVYIANINNRLIRIVISK